MTCASSQIESRQKRLPFDNLLFWWLKSFLTYPSISHFPISPKVYLFNNHNIILLPFCTYLKCANIGRKQNFVSRNWVHSNKQCSAVQPLWLRCVPMIYLESENPWSNWGNIIYVTKKTYLLMLYFVIFQNVLFEDFPQDSRSPQSSKLRKPNWGW